MFKPSQDALDQLQHLQWLIQRHLDQAPEERAQCVNFADTPEVEFDALICTAGVLWAALRVLVHEDRQKLPPYLEEELLRLTQDLARTLIEVHPQGSRPGSTVESALSQARQDVRPWGVALTLPQVSAAAAFLEAHYRTHGLWDARQGLLGFLLPDPGPLHSPTRPATTDCLPRTAAHFPELFTLATTGREEVAVCAGLLLWVSARHEETGIEVLSLLTAARRLICVVQDQDREQGQPAEEGTFLLTTWKALHQALGQPRLICGKAPIIRRSHEMRVLAVAWNELRRARLVSQGWRPSSQRRMEEITFEQFEELEEVLSQDAPSEDPERLAFTRRMLQLTTIMGLVITPRVPGQPMPVLLEVLC